MLVVNAMFGRGLGGIEQSFLDYCLALRDEGNEVIAMVHPKAAIIPQLQAQNIHFIAINNYGQWDLMTVKRLKQQLATLKPATVICHGNRAISLLRPAAAGICPVIGMAHNYKIDRLTKLDGAFTITQQLKHKVISNGGNADHVFHIPNMIDSYGKKLNHDITRIRTCPVFGTMGRMVEKKGFQVLIEACSILQSQCHDFKCLIGGDGEMRDKLELMVEEYGLVGQVIFTGWVKDKSEFFNQLDIFCLPSIHEPFGIVLLEACAAGLPVITSSSEGPSEIVHHDEDAYVVPVNDANALAKAMVFLSSHPDYAIELGQNALETVRRHYDRSVIRKRLQSALEHVVATQ